MKISTYSGQLRCKHFSVAIRNGKVITPVLCNKYRTHVFGQVKGSMHAEMTVIKHICSTRNFQYKIYKTPDHKLYKFLKKVDIIVIRIGCDGTILNSKPCTSCLNVLKLLHIRNVYYTNNSGELESHRVKDLLTIHQSRFQLHINKLMKIKD